MQRDASVLRVAEYLERAVQAETKAATALMTGEREAYLAIAAYWRRRAEDTAREHADEDVPPPPEEGPGG